MSGFGGAGRNRGDVREQPRGVVSGTYALGLEDGEDEFDRRSAPSLKWSDEAVPSSRRIPPEQCVEAWCHCSETYEVFANEVTRPFATDAARLVRVVDGARVLDVAAGTGAFTFAAAERGGSVLATDFSPRMIDGLRRGCTTRGLDSVETAVMDGMNLNLPDESFDVVGSLFGLMFFPDHERGLRELHRVLKPGGQAVVATWAPPARVEMMRLVGEAAMGAGIEVSTGGPPNWLSLANGRQLRQRLLDFGFAQAHVVCLTHVWVLERAETLADLLPLMTPSSAELLSGLEPPEKERFKQALVSSFHERQGDGPYAVTSEALIGVGRKAR